ncbi:hypothetical protein [Pseudomonas sp. JL3]|uniref:hypothetical protein n=1 Tax=Pseudomonas sp. JL3 TaxID=2919943 RepID=UPI00285DDADD|nr:hypothetical protein [Pseudomonas sp. JL3]MDR8364111.1 hypothetical protein [Pseudomonas sp. JL3]
MAKYLAQLGELPLKSFRSLMQSAVGFRKSTLIEQHIGTPAQALSAVDSLHGKAIDDRQQNLVAHANHLKRFKSLCDNNAPNYRIPTLYAPQSKASMPALPFLYPRL